MNHPRRMRKPAFGLVVLLLMSVPMLLAGVPQKEKGNRLEKTTGNDLYRPFLINNVFNYYGNNGDGSYNKFSTDNEGFEFYKGTGQHAIFEDGVVWGGYHKGRVDASGNRYAKVGGSVYRHGLQAGPILTYGTATADPVAANADDASYRIYRVRPDINPHVTFDEVQAKIESDEVAFIGRYESYSAQDIYNQYVQDWNEWPADEGAPFTDVDSNGVYDPNVDIPGQPGSDQTLWYVANDMNTTNTNYLAGSPPIGLEMRRTIWGYRRAGALGQTIFMSTILINKSGAPIDSMFLVQWSDPDLGYAGDDFVGCDTTRSLGYVYNGAAVDPIYGVACPAAGFDFFQGPLVAGAATDTAIFRLHKRPGFKNLPMSAFVFFTQGNANYADPTQGSGGDIEWYRLMKGLVAKTGGAFIDPVTGNPTKFCLYGDAANYKDDGSVGWVDGMGGLTAQDRRMCMVTGPFSMAAGDTQELVVANLAGLGADRFSSVSVLRAVDDKAQAAYDNLFVLPSPPPAPVVSVAELDGEIVLSWGDPKGVAKTEGTVDQGFEFQGYKVYEFPGPSTSGGRLIASFDLNDGVKAISDTVFDPATGYNVIDVLQIGKDNGISRTLEIKSSAVTGNKLVDGSRYYFAVTAYSYNANPPAAAGTHALEDPQQVITVIPHSANPGIAYPSAVGDTLPSTHSQGLSDGSVLARVVNPSALTGDTYRVTFATLGGSAVWNLLRIHGTTIDTVAKNQTDQTGLPSGAIIVDGVEFRVKGAPNDFKNFLTVSNANGALSPPEAGAFGFNDSGFPLGPPLPAGTDRPDGARQQSKDLVTGTGWGIHTGMNAPNMDPGYEYFITRVTNSGGRWPLIIPYDFEIRFTTAGGKALVPADFGSAEDRLIDVPFELWNIGSNTPDDPSDDYRMFPNILDVDGNYAFNLLSQAGVDSVDNGGGGADHTISGGANDPFTDWIYWVEPEDTSPGQAGYNAIVTAVQDSITAGVDPYLGGGTAGTDVLRRVVLVGWNFGDVSDPAAYLEQMPEAGTTFRIVSTKPNTTSDQFTVTVPAVIQSTDAAKADVTKINVFPNPYIGFNPQETNKYTRFVTFNHLPQQATIRIFNLAGILVRTLMKDDATQFMRWDLNNESGFPVAAGMYVVYIDMHELGTKTLKLGVVPEQQYLDRW